MRFFFTLLFFLCSALILNAQPYNNPKGRLTGKVIDASTKQPVDYATVSIFKDGGTSPINGVVTDPKGDFVVTNLNPGEYSISIDFIGYQKKTIDHLTIGGTTPNITLGTISLAPIQNHRPTYINGAIMNKS